MKCCLRSIRERLGSEGAAGKGVWVELVGGAEGVVRDRSLFFHTCLGIIVHRPPN